jgi:hypothetical protein
MAALTWQCPSCGESSDYEGTCPVHLTPFVPVPLPNPMTGTTSTDAADAMTDGTEPDDTGPDGNEAAPTARTPVDPASSSGSTPTPQRHPDAADVEPVLAPPLRRLALRTPWRQQIELPEHGALVIGRSSPELKDNPTAREMLQISRRHARFYRDPSGDLYVEDLGSTNGTFLNGLPVADRGSRLSPGQTLRLGQDVECVVIALNEFGEPHEEQR